MYRVIDPVSRRIRVVRAKATAFDVARAFANDRRGGVPVDIQKLELGRVVKHWQVECLREVCS